MDLPIEALVINLVRRVDRLVLFKQCFPFRSRTLDAFDGSILSDQLQVKLLSSSQLRMIESLNSFARNPKPMVPGIFGCWQSHILIWNELADSLDESKKYLVLEDDAIPTKDIHLILPKVLNCLPEDFDLAFLGGQDTPNYTRPQNQFEHSIKVTCSDGCDLSWNRLTSAHLNTTSAYVVTKRGARSLLELLASHLDNCEPLLPIDHFIRNSSDTLENYEIATHIFNSPWDSPESDIRFPGFHNKETPTSMFRNLSHKIPAVTKEVPMENKPSKSELLRQQSQTQMLPIDMTNYLKKIRDTYKFHPKVVYDIGSNLLHWVNEARNIWTEAEFFLFDATDSLEFLYKENNFRYHMGVLSDLPGKEVDFYQNDESTGGNSYYRENEILSPAAKYLYDDLHIKKLRTETLDEVVNLRKFPAPSLVKIDVQGAELDIIKGGIKTISACAHLIVELRKLEYNLGAPEAEETIQFLDTLGFVNVGEFCSNRFDADYHFVNTHLIG